jgi:hypothetical protein
VHPCLQVVEEAQQPLGEFYRHISKGAWPFSTRDHGWPISDCSSEGLKAALVLAEVGRRGWVWVWAPISGVAADAQHAASHGRPPSLR